MDIEVRRTPIQNFYAGQSIFITGGTGFLGKVLIEKLLRSCPDISMIYLLIRSKKDKCPENRIDEMFKTPLYHHMKEEIPNFRKKIMPIIGDVDIEGFGLSENHKNILINQVSIIFHVAANVRFHEKINISTTVNINAVNDIMKLAKCMPNLKSLIHVSTAYANCHVDHIEERFYSYPINHKDFIMLIRNLPENVIQEKMSRIISRWPNIYTFTKAIAEGLLRDESGDLPVGIFRPAAVLSTAREPLVGWIDNMYGPIGFAISLLLGILRIHRCSLDSRSNIVPVDFTVNAIIASAFDVFNQCRRGKDMLIYNFVSTVNTPTWDEYISTLLDINKMYPLHKAIYFPMIIRFQHKIPYRICVWLFHFLPALFMDVVNVCVNGEPRMWKLYTKVDKFFKAIEPFCNKNWSFSTNNVQTMWNYLDDKDQQLFKFNMMEFDWSKYLIDHYMGMRLYLLNEDNSTLEISRIKYKRLYWIHQTVKAVTTFAFFSIMWLMFRVIKV